MFHEWPGVQLGNGKWTSFSACDTTLLFVIGMYKLQLLSSDDLSEDGRSRAGGLHLSSWAAGTEMQAVNGCTDGVAASTLGGRPCRL